MEIIETGIDDLILIKPRVFEDNRGYFYETFNKNSHSDKDLQYDWVQDNEAFSLRGTLRGLHYQVGEFCQAKLVRVIMGEVQDVVVDLRSKSPTYGKHYSVNLSQDNKLQLLVPRGFAHGYLVLSKEATFAYKCDNFYNKAAEGGIRYNDPSLGVSWELPLSQVLVSEKDEILPGFGQHIDLSL